MPLKFRSVGSQLHHFPKHSLANPVHLRHIYILVMAYTQRIFGAPHGELRWGLGSAQPPSHAVSRHPTHKLGKFLINNIEN